MWNHLERFHKNADVSDLDTLIDSFIEVEKQDESFASHFVNRCCNDSELEDFAKKHTTATKRENKQEDIELLKEAYKIWAVDKKLCSSSHRLYGSVIAPTSSQGGARQSAPCPAVPVDPRIREENDQLKLTVSELQSRIEEFEALISSVEEEKQKLEAEREELQNKFHGLQAQLRDEDGLTLQLNEKNAEIEALRRQLNENMSPISDGSEKEELGNLRQQLAEKNVELSVLEQKLAEKESQLGTSEQQIDMLRKDIEQLSGTLSDKSNEINTFKQNVAEKQQTIEELSLQLEAKKQAINNLEQQISVFRMEIAAYQQQLNEKDEKISVLTQNVAEKQQTIEELSLQLEAKKQAINNLEQQISVFRMEIAAYQQQLNEKDEKISVLTQNVAVLEAEKQRLEGELVTYKAILPAEILSLVGIGFENYADASLRTLLFSFLLVTSHSPIEDESFLIRFNTFDKELFRLFKNDPEKLASLRKHFQEFLNNNLEHHTINWDLIGNVYDEERHRTDDSLGQTVLAVESALITGRTCQRAKVRTSNE